MQVTRIESNKTDLVLFASMLSFVAAFAGLIGWHNRAGTPVATVPTTAPTAKENVVTQYGMARAADVTRRMMKGAGLPEVRADSVVRVDVTFAPFRVSAREDIQLDLAIAMDGYTSDGHDSRRLGARTYTLHQVGEPKPIWSAHYQSVLSNRGVGAGDQTVSVTSGARLERSKGLDSTFRSFVGRTALPPGEYLLTGTIDKLRWATPISRIDLIVRKDVPPPLPAWLMVGLMTPALICLLALVWRGRGRALRARKPT